MIVNPNSYPRGMSSDILTTARVTVACDECENKWETQYSNYKNYKKKRSYKEDLCQSCKNRRGICGMKDRHHSPEIKKKLSSINSGSGNGFYGKSHSEKQKEKWSQFRTGRKCRSQPMTDQEKKHRAKVTKAYWSGLSEEEKAHRLSLVDYSEIRKKLLCNGGQYSGLHKKVKKDMIKIGLSGFESEEKVGKYIVDEVNHDKKIIVEVNGDYWHANPSRYDADEIIAYPKKTCKAKEVWEKDDKRIKDLKHFGFKVHVIWESDVKKQRHITILESIKDE